MGPFDPNTAPAGGQTLTGLIHQRLFPGQAYPATADMHAAANAVLDPQSAFEFASGARVHPDAAYKVALQLGQQQAASGLQDAQRQFMTAPVGGPQQQAQAVADVQAAMGGTPGAANGGVAGPNGATNGRPPIVNLARWDGARATYQRHADQMMTLAGASGEKQAISQVAAEPTAAGKAAVRDAYLAATPGADMSRFTPQLMKGT